MEDSFAKEELFDLSDQYEAMLNRGIRLSGEDQYYFIAGRIGDLNKQLPDGWKPRRILDFGCGIGHAAPFLAEAFPDSDIVGVDTAEQALEHATKTHGSARISFRHIHDLDESEAFDLCYVNGVFHHIEPLKRPEVLRVIHRSLRPGGYFSLFENNPWNPGTRMVMARIPFDRDAITLSPYETERIVRTAGFRLDRTRSLFYFPRPLAWLRFVEPSLARLPLGAQYYVLAFKP